MPGKQNRKRDTRTAGNAGPLKLTDDHRMLLEIRDSLYDGDWSAFVGDLTARAESKPHVFETVPASDDLVSTIHHHLALIDEMSAWESATGRRLPSPPGVIPTEESSP